MMIRTRRSWSDYLKETKEAKSNTWKSEFLCRKKQIVREYSEFVNSGDIQMVQWHFLYEMCTKMTKMRGYCQNKEP